MAEAPNILVIRGDDIGVSNLSCSSDGPMGHVELRCVTRSDDADP